MSALLPNEDYARMDIVQIQHNAHNATGQEVDKLYQDDAVWIITSSFIIFTMHSGFGLLESGSVSAKDEVNIMVKNVVDVVFGGLSYWSIGYGLSFGDYAAWRNPYVGWGKFFYDPTREEHASVNDEGWAYAAFLFQLSLATTASTIVSGAVAERAKLKSYILLGCLVILIQALPAHWVWDKEGVFKKLGVIDFAGCSAVHMVGGIIGLIATVYLKPRRNRFNEDSVHQMSSPTNALLGTFLLWWGWFGINAGSVWGITNGRWRLGARAAVATIMSSIGGGATSIIISFIKTKKLQVHFLINGILSSIVSITALCAVARPWHALFIGSVSSAFSISVLPLLEKLHIDDPVGIVPIHLTSSIWGMIAVGIFCERDKYLLAATGSREGLLYSGSPKLLYIQLACVAAVLLYSAAAGLLVLVIISKSPLGLRVTDYEEQIGADVIEHGLAGTNVARYVIEKPLSTRTFQTVTKAIAKWKMLAKTKSRSKRMEQARLKRLEEEGLAHTTTSNGGIGGNGAVANGVVHRRTPRSNGGRTIKSSRDGPISTAIDIEPAPITPVHHPLPPVRTARAHVTPRPPSVPSGPGSSAVEEQQLPSTPSKSNAGSSRTSARAPEDRQVSSAQGRPSTMTRFIRSPQPRRLSPPLDENIVDTPQQTPHSTGSHHGLKNNKVTPE